jgi:hypothetical protein
MTKEAKTLKLLKSGWITSLDCALKGGCLSLSQRVSNWRSAGYVIGSKWVVTRSGSRVMAYRLLRVVKG